VEENYGRFGGLWSIHKLNISTNEIIHYISCSGAVAKVLSTKIASGMNLLKFFLPIFFAIQYSLKANE